MPELINKIAKQGSVRLALIYMWRYLVRRGPNAVKRWFGTGWRTASVKRADITADVTRVGAYVTGGVGDHIIAARFLRDLRKTSEPFTFDIFSASPAIAKWIFASVQGFQNCSYDSAFDSAIQHYDVALDISSIVKLRKRESNEGNDIGPSRALERSLIRISAFQNEMQPFIESSVRMDGFIAQKLQFRNVTRTTSLHHIAAIEYGGDQYPLEIDEDCVHRLGLEPKRYITVHNGFEAQFITSGARATKCYPHFDEVVALLKQKFPGVEVVQIGSTTSVPIRSVDLNLIGKTTLKEASAIIKNAVAHLDNESGMVHIASCFSVPCCVVFGPTPADYFGYADNANVRPKSCGNCWWITEDWMERCPRGFKEAICTYTQSPNDVAHAMTEIVSRVIEENCMDQITFKQSIGLA